MIGLDKRGKAMGWQDFIDFLPCLDPLHTQAQLADRVCVRGHKMAVKPENPCYLSDILRFICNVPELIAEG